MSSEGAASCAYGQEGFVQLRKILPDGAQDVVILVWETLSFS